MKNVILSKKLTFSLTSLVVMLVFGLAVYVPPAMADHGHFNVSISAAETMIDVSSDDGMQVASGRDRADRALTADTDREATLITLLIKTDQIVNLGDPDAGVTDPDLTGRSGAAIDAAAINELANAVLDISDLVVDAYDAEGRSLGILNLKLLQEAANVIVLSHRDPNNPGREFLARIDESRLTDAYTAARGGGATLEIHTLLFSIPPKVMERADIAYVTAVRNDAEGDHDISQNNRAEVFRVDLVDDDEGLAQYNTGVGATAVTAGVPGVVAIQSLRERAGFIETGDFTVRVILTEEPAGGLTTDLVMVMNGSAASVAKGATLKGTSTAPAQTSELTRDIARYTDMDGGVDGTLPEPTGRDNKFHQYFVTITPNAGHNGYVTVSIKQFDDKVLPVPNMYVPLAENQVVATTLTDDQETVRDARVMNERLMVRVNSAGDAKVAAAKDAYDARQKVLDAVTNEITLGNKTYIPAGGFLVLTADVGKAGIQASDAKTKDKTGAELLYNTHGLGLPFPADDLDNFFRNGGTLNLGYADIPEATGSGHGDSKGATGDDATGYTAADSTAHAAGDLIINEIMWGLDGASKDSQYIELHNTTDKAIGIDNKEWVISVGALPTGYAAIDTVSNNPASGFWAAPGSGGVTEASAQNPVVSDLVSMSRVMDGTDGTMAASWVESIRPSANLSGRRIGTPGAANKYAMAPAPPPPAPAPMADVATGADIKISEIMIASNDGRNPQWIELANVSGAEVSLSGWSIDIDNDPTDTDVIGASINVEIGDVTVGKDQVVLVVSKSSTRNSGVGMGEGDIREDRIVDIQDQVSEDERYSLISEMAFTISLIPPQTSGVVERGDVVGNLGMGWELPMSEGSRSSIIRSDNDTDAGTDAADWVLASSTMLNGQYRTTFYGDDEDAGTPGYDAGGALPVELSKFDAKRDKVTGQVTIVWETQSELNNAGFFIKRSQQRNGQFKVVNPTMIAGAGTTSEKQSYTYTDTTAQPNIVYYYQIEDVSLDGNRQTLTRAHRLKGHIGAAGKATTTWGELKTSRTQ